MSHQDQGRSSAERTHGDDLCQALRWLVPKRVVGKISFRDDCTWTPYMLALAGLLWAWSDYRPLVDRFAAARKIIRHWFGRQQEPAASYQAFIKLLRKWTEPLCALLQQAFRERMAEALVNAWTVGGWIVFACDGSRVDVPRTRRNEIRYSPNSPLARAAQKRARKRKRRRLSKKRRAQQEARQRKANVPRIWLTVLWHVASGLPWDWRTGASDSSERAHLQAMLSTLPPGSLITADAGFVGYDLWHTIQAAGHHLLVRVGGNVRLLKQLGYARHRAGLVYLWPDAVAKKKQPPLVLRLVKIRGGRHPVYVVTTVQSTRQLSDTQVAEIYARRWGIELFYRHCKQTFERRKLRSHTPDHADIELTWSLLGMWAMGLHSHHRLVAQGVSPNRISFAGVLRAYRQSMRDYRSPVEAGTRLANLIDRAIIDDYERKNKTSRDYPRQKQQRLARPPIISKATPAQRRKAKQVKEEQELWLTA